jgi:hypothetical protein
MPARAETVLPTKQDAEDKKSFSSLTSLLSNSGMGKKRLEILVNPNENHSSRWQIFLFDCLHHVDEAVPTKVLQYKQAKKLMSFGIAEQFRSMTYE